MSFSASQFMESWVPVLVLSSKPTIWELRTGWDGFSLNLSQFSTWFRLPCSSSPWMPEPSSWLLSVLHIACYCILLLSIIHNYPIPYVCYPHLPYTLCPEIKDPENRPSLVTIAVEMTPSLRVDACKEWCPAVQERMCLSCNPLPPPPLTSLKLTLHSKWLLPLLMKWC